MANTLEWKNITLVEEVERLSGTPVSACYQCHKCSTGCPTAEEMDFLSSQVIRLVHLGEEEEVLGSRAIWLCASCEACTARCPMGIDVAAVMDALRILAVKRKAAIPDARGEKFNRSFLGSVRRHGRVFELGMLAAYKLRSGDLFSDVGKLPRMLAKGRICLWPRRSGDAKQIRDLFRRCEEEDEQR
ncbi:MAG: 4Fe-4S dicluster domain-containing protein [Planctomycetota bacterium]